MKHLNIIFKLSLSPLVIFFIIFNIFSHAEDEPNDSCTQANVILEDGTDSNSDSGASSSGDQDFYYFDVPSNGELNVTIENTSTSKSLIYSSLSSGCPSSAPTTLLKGSSVTLSIPSTSDTKYYIYVEGVANSPATTYTISARFIPNTLSEGIDLKITKAGSIDTTLIYDDFYYQINVSNIGEDNASGVIVTDSFPDGMSVDLTATNAASPEWNCSDTADNTTNVETELSPITCTLDGNLTTASVSSIILHVNAPSTADTITNEVNVTSDGTDVDTSNNTATETTEIINEVDTAEDLCYTEYTPVNAETNSTCEKVGNFYYGSTCKAYVAITDVNLTSNLSEIIIYKMYAPDISSGACTYTTDGSDPNNAGSPSCNNVDNATDFGGYHGGYAIDTNESIIDASDVEILINDIGSDNNPRVDGIAMFGDYWTAEGFHHTGRIFACSGISEGGIEVTTSADVIDTLITDAATANNYNNSIVPNPTPFDPTDGNIKYIQTMVAADVTREIVGVHLNLDGEATPYIYLGTEDTIPYSITPYLTDNACSSTFENIIDPTTGIQLVIDIPYDSANPNPYYSATGTMIVSETVRQNARMQMIFVDPNTLSPEGQQCLANSSTTGNFARLAQCVNSEVQYKTAFGQDAWDRCGTGNGNPCDPSYHGYSCGEDDASCAEYNALYDSELGCYMCTFDVQPSCSTDNFAIRPDRFDTNIVETNVPTHYPNLLRSGQDYNTSLTARNDNNEVSSNYTVLNFHEIVQTPPAKKYFNGPTGSPWIEDIGGLLLEGEVPPPTPIDPSHMVNGLSSLTTSVPGSAEPTISVTFNDVGRVGIYVADVNWSQVDNDDTPMDCNSSEHTYICGELNVTFIPHHFSFAELNITNHAGPDSNFTYVADNRGMPTTNLPIRSPMAARVHTRIEARNKQDGITQNFKEDGTSPELYYENNISITQNVKIPTTRTLPNEPDAYLFGDDANESKIDNKRIGFGRVTAPETDDPGTRNIKWDESTYPLEFNFKRELHKPENPFDVNGTYFSIAATSTYIDPSDGETAIIDGSRIGDDNASTSTCIAPPTGSCVHANADAKATFYYGRTRSSKFFYEQITGPSVITPIAIDVYCDLGFTVCNDFGIDTVNGEINEPDWWLSWNHNMDRGDGNVTIETGTLLEGAGTPKLNNGGGEANRISIDITTEGVDENVTVIGHTTSRPMTVPIELVNNIDPASPYYTLTLPYTNGWLIYNKYTDSLLQALPVPFYKVRFIGESTWTGEGQTGHVVDINASYKKSNRVDW